MANKSVHFVGVAGAFMAGAARLAVELGHAVSGSDDNFYPPMGEQARMPGIALHEGYESDCKRRPADVYVIGNAVSRGNPLLESILREHRPYVSAAEWLYRNVLAERTVLAVAGTHGKTTTVSLLAWLLEKDGKSPGFLQGGVAQNFGVSARLGKAPFFVVEGDEYDTAFFDKRPKFLHYRPGIAVVNNLEFDHADIYRDIGEIVRQVHYLFRSVADNGVLVARTANEHVAAALAMGHYSPLIGIGDGADWRWRFSGGEMSVDYRGEMQCRFAPPLAGAANRDNILAAMVAALQAGVPVARSARHLSGFLPPLRRLQLLSDAGDVLLFDDFAHHPTAYQRTIEALAEMHPRRRVIAVFEPRSNTMKQGYFQKQLAAAFAGASTVVAVANRVHWSLSDALAPLGERAVVAANADEAHGLLMSRKCPGDCIVLMSNGDFDGLADRVKNSMKIKAIES